MGIIKKLLYKLLKETTYLKTLHRSFYFLYSLGILKKDERFKYHYMVKKVIEPNFNIIDIGANLGYFSKTFARLIPNGKLISIEPVPQFYKVLSYFLKHYKNAIVFNVALGDTDGFITMVLPKSNGMIRTGLPHIAESEEEKSQHATQEVAIVKGTELFKDLTALDYIKCDIEGYELTVFEEIKPILAKFEPFVQLEISPKNTDAILAIFSALGYTQFGISNFKFVQETGIQQEEGDYFFVPKKRLAGFKEKFAC
jgi:FkbM family methyltransferase